MLDKIFKVCILCVCCWHTLFFGQSTVTILHAEKMEQVKTDTGEFRLLTGRVEIETDSTYIYSDTIYQFLEAGRIRAQNGVRITRPDTTIILANTIEYFQDIQMADLKGKVSLSHKGNLITTDKMLYFTDIGRAECMGNVQLTTDSVTVKSIKATYYSEDEHAVFFPKATKAVMRDAIFVADTLEYYRKSGDVFGQGRCNYANTKGVRANAQLMRYQKQFEYIQLEGNAFASDSGLAIAAEVVSRHAVNGTRAECFVMGRQDSTYFIGDSIWHRDSVSYVYGESMVFQDDTDTFALQASDSLRIYKTVDSIQGMEAYGKVQFVIENRIALADKVFASDTGGYMIAQPAQISEDSIQYFSDSIVFWKHKDSSDIDSIYLTGKALIIQEVDSLLQYYSSLEGKLMRVNFTVDSLILIYIEQNAIAKYFLEDDSKAYIGQNTTESVKMRVVLANKSIRDIQCTTKPTGIMLPISDLKSSELGNSNWKPLFKPTYAAWLDMQQKSRTLFYERSLEVDTAVQD